MDARRKGTGAQAERSNGANAAAGGNGKPRKVKFQVKAVEGCEVFLAGSFNNWDPKAIAMKRDGSGLHVASVRLPPGRHEYKFLVNGVWQTDEQCQQWVPNSYGSLNSVVEVT